MSCTRVLDLGGGATEASKDKFFGFGNQRAQNKFNFHTFFGVQISFSGKIVIKTLPFATQFLL